MILSALMVCTMAPMSAIAAPNSDATETQVTEETSEKTSVSDENDDVSETEAVKGTDNVSESKENVEPAAQDALKDAGNAAGENENTAADVGAAAGNDAASEEIKDITATGVDFSTEPTEKVTYKAGEGTITFTPATAQSLATITLDNATLSGTNKKSSRANLVNVNGNYNVVLNGSNTISGFESAIGSGKGNLEASKVTFSGTGSLNVTDCDYFAHSLRDTIFDGVQLNVNVRLNGILTMGIAEFKNGTNAVFTSQDSDSANIQAQSGTYINSKSHVEINGKYAGIYLAMVYYSRPEKGVEIDDAELEMNTSSFGIVSENYPITIHNAKVNIKNTEYGMYTAYEKAYTSAERKIDISGNSDVRVQAKYGVVTSDMQVKDKSEVEIISSNKVNLRAAGVDTSEHHYAFKTLVNMEATKDGAGDWDQTTTMDQFKYLHILPVTYDLTDVSVSAKADAVYNGAAQTPEVDKKATATNGEDVTFTYATEENGTYTEEIPSFTEAGTYTIYYKANAESHNEVTGHFTFTIKNAAQEAPAVTGQAETISKKADGTISGLTTDMEYATEENGPYTKVTNPEMTFVAGTYYVRYPAKANYDVSQPTKITIAVGRKLTVTVPQNQEGYTLTVDKTELDWHEKVTLTYTLKSGYEEVAGEFGILLNGTPVTLNQGSFTAENNETDAVFTINGVRAISEAGDYEHITLEDNFGAGDLKNSVEDLKTKIPVTEEELAQINSGKNMKIFLVVKDATASVSANDKAKAEAKLAKDQKIGMYLDISLFKQIENQEAVKISNTNGMITVTFKVPENLLNKDGKVTRTYQIIRVHNDVAEVINADFDAKSGTVTFETDQFSTYALAYKDTPKKATTDNKTQSTTSGTTGTSPKTADDTPLGLLYVTLFGSCAVLGAGLMGKKRRKHVRR